MRVSASVGDDRSLAWYVCTVAAVSYSFAMFGLARTYVRPRRTLIAKLCAPSYTCTYITMRGFWRHLCIPCASRGWRRGLRPALTEGGSVLTYTGLEEGKRGEVRICRHTNLNCVWCVSFATHQTLWMQNYLCIDSDGCRMYYKCCGRYMQCIFYSRTAKHSTIYCDL